MSPLRKISIQGGIVFCVTAVVLLSWVMIIVPDSQKLSDEYTLDVEYESQTTMVDNVYGELRGPFFQHDILSEKVIEKNGNILTIESSVTGTDAVTHEVMFHVENIYTVDAVTQTHVDKEGKQFGFLPGVEKKDYDFLHSAVFYDDPMVFKRTDIVNGLNVYIFEVTTKGADTSRAFPQFAPHVIFTDTTSRLWIEPITGNLIKFEKDWDNYLVEDGQRVNTIQTGEKVTSEFTEIILTQYTNAKIETMNFNNIVMPGFLAITLLIIGITWILFTNLKTIKRESIQLQVVDRQKDELVSMLSHEIKNPLTPIVLICEQLLMEKDGDLNETQRHKINIILKNGHQINELLTDFTEIKKLDLEKLTLSKTEIDLKEYLENVVESVRPFTGEKNIQLHLKLEKTWKITIDQKRISQVISNLIKNAIDFIPENTGKITIFAEHKDRGTVISVEDNGIGISQNDADVVFEKFIQLDNAGNIKHEGTGLGLSICKGIVEAHGGTIWLDKKYESGAKFQFLIPN